MGRRMVKIVEKQIQVFLVVLLHGVPFKKSFVFMVHLKLNFELLRFRLRIIKGCLGKSHWFILPETTMVGLISRTIRIIKVLILILVRVILLIVINS